MNTTTLIRSANGSFRPQRPEPRTAAEARDYLPHRALADLANEMVGEVESAAADTLRWDNSQHDTHADKGTVVLPLSGVNGGSADYLGLKQSLIADPGTGKPVLYEREMSGTKYYGKPGLSFDSELLTVLANYLPTERIDVPVLDRTVIKTVPLLEVSRDITHQKPKSDRKYSQHSLLRETQPGIFTMEYEMVDNLGLVHFSPSGE